MKDLVMKNKLTAKTAIELKEKIYKNEGWVPKYPENRMKRCVEAYDIIIDYKKNIFVATKKKS